MSYGSVSIVSFLGRQHDRVYPLPESGNWDMRGGWEAMTKGGSDGTNWIHWAGDHGAADGAQSSARWFSVDRLHA